MNINEIKQQLEAEKKAREAAEATVMPVEGVEGVKPVDDLAGLELVDLNGVDDVVLFTVADIAYRVAGIRTSRLVQSDPKKEIGGLIAYLLEGNAKNARQRRAWLVTYVTCINRLVQNASALTGVLQSVRDLRAESAEDAAYRLLKCTHGRIAEAQALALKEGREVPKWVFNKALERLTAEIFAKMA